MIIKIGITCGDPAGIGPEISLRAVNELKDAGIIPILIGREEVVKKYYSQYFTGYNIIKNNSDLSSLEENNKYFLDVEINSFVPSPGIGTIETGHESKIYIDRAIDLWKEGKIHAIVTGPVSKSLIEKSGTPFIGHTEYFAEAIGEENPVMMMYSEQYRVVLVTTHIPLSHVSENVTLERLLKIIEIGHKSISAIDDNIDDIKIAITGMDPHCGDEGAINDFDLKITQKAVDIAIESGLSLDGPFAADTIFLSEKWKKYNLVIAHYHDQGLIPFKMLSFDSGVNVTLGLSMIRTSVDHGTAFDIAGKSIASYNSMLQAIKLASKLVMNRGI